jgi:hypothetical protein
VLKTEFSLRVAVTENNECVDIVPPQDANIQIKNEELYSFPPWRLHGGSGTDFTRSMYSPHYGVPRPKLESYTRTSKTIPEGFHLHISWCENLKSQNYTSFKF